MDSVSTETLPPRLLANALRFLALDAVEQANSGHPGMPMGMADIAEVVWRHHLRHNPGMGRCCCMGCCTSRGTICRWRR
jgi:transketolase